MNRDIFSVLVLSFIHKERIGCHDKIVHHVGGVEGLSIKL